MQVHVEFYGIPRTRAGRERLTVSLSDPCTLGDACLELGRQLPRFAEDCLDGGQLRAGYLACIEGKEFTRDPQTRIAEGASLLILSADVGG